MSIDQIIEEAAIQCSSIEMDGEPEREECKAIIKAAIEKVLCKQEKERKDYFPFTPKDWPT